MWPESIHFVKDMAQIIFDFVPYRNFLLKEEKVIHLGPALQINHSVDKRIHLLNIGNENLTDLGPELLLDLLADRMNNYLRERLVNVLFVVIYGNLW
jgi:hypothetical protein